MEKLLQLLFSWLKDLGSPTQPYIKNSRNKRLINYWWSKTFYNDNNLQKLAPGYPLHPQQGRGLIYHYIIRGQVRYVGQTRERSLKWRITRRQPNGNIGYKYSIKRQMLNAFRSGTLRIQTKEVLLADLDTIEKQDIKSQPQSNRLWNINHNDNYRRSNRWF